MQDQVKRASRPGSGGLCEDKHGRQPRGWTLCGDYVLGSLTRSRLSRVERSSFAGGTACRPATMHACLPHCRRARLQNAEQCSIVGIHAFYLIGTCA